jgi:hypothetical protein
VREHGAAAPPAYLRSSTRAATAATTTRTPARPPLAAGAAARRGAIGARFYEPDDAEAELRERLAELRRARGRSDG